MSDTFYKLVRAVGTSAFWVSAVPVVMGLENIPRAGACIIAATHQCPYDVPLLIRHAPRLLDFVSITEVFRQPMVGWLYTNLNAFPLDRSRPDAKAVRRVLDRLAKGRVIAMFPEGGFRRGIDSVISNGHIRPGVGRIAQIASVPIVPCVIFNSLAYARFRSWLPFRATRYGVAFGAPIASSEDHPQVEANLVLSMRALHASLRERVGVPDLNAPAI